MAKTAYVWDGTQFISISSPIAAVPNAVAIYNSASPSSTIGTIWNDTSSGVLKLYTGSSWINVGIQYSSVAPSNAIAGTMWVDSNGPSLKVYNGSTWIEAGGGATDSD